MVPPRPEPVEWKDGKNVALRCAAKLSNAAARADGSAARAVTGTVAKMLGEE